MRRTIGLYEYLGVEVHERSDVGTALTASGEIFDDDNGLAMIDATRGEGTIITHANTDTHDDGLGVLDLGGFGDDGTIDTRTRSETYDDAGIEGLGDLAIYAESTIITKVEAETYDDDPGLGGLASL